MIIYIAAKSEFREFMQEIRDDLQKRGHEVRASWLDQDVMGSVRDFNERPQEMSAFARADLKQIAECELFLTFTTDEGGGMGGRHVELGVALALAKNIMVVGPRENIFHTLPQVKWFPDWKTFVRDSGIGPIK